jgi:hypothetical protein
MIVRNDATRSRTLQQAMAALRNSGVRVTGRVVIVCTAPASLLDRRNRCGAEATEGRTVRMTARPD